MPRSNSTMIHKLQAAMNEKFKAGIIVNKTQFYSQRQGRPINIYTVKKARTPEAKNKDKRTGYIELFSSTSQLQIVLFMRDYWYELNGWEIPTDNEDWNKAKQQYYSKR